MNIKLNSYMKTIVLILPFLYGCTSLDNEMNEDKFWEIIQSSQYDCDEDKYQDECLKTILSRYKANQILEFYTIFNQYHRKADRGDIWAAGMLLNSGHGTDDGFVYFRNWLISSGKEVYTSALNNPDNLANVDIYIDEEGHPDAEFEAFPYVAVELYEKKTNGRILYDDLDENNLKAESDWNWSDYDTEKWLTENLPQLYKKYGHLKKQSDQDLEAHLSSIKTINEVNVPNIGVIKVNKPIYHKTYGKGIIVEIFPYNKVVTVHIEFSDGIHQMILNTHSKIDSLFSLKPYTK